MEDFGYGHLQPEDTTSDFNVISFIVAQALTRVRTTTLVKVVAVNSPGGVAPAGTVDVLPLINGLDGNGNAVPHQTVFGMPYIRMQGGANAVIMDPVVGDIGIAVISDRDASAVKATQAQANPGSLRKHNLADGIYVGGILNGTPTQFIEFTSSGIIISDKNGNKIDMEAGLITVTGNMKVTGTLEAGSLATEDGNLVVDGNLTVDGTSDLKGNATLEGTADIKGVATFEDNVVNTNSSKTLHFAGGITAGFGTGDSVGLQSHTHHYNTSSAPPIVGIDTFGPNPGT